MSLSNFSKLLFLLIPAIFLFSSFQAWSVFLKDDEQGGLSRRASPETLNRATNGITSFTADTLQRLLTSSPNKNIFISAFSLSTALSMAAEGARGETQKEMLQALRLSMDPSDVAPSFSQILEVSSIPQNEYQLQLSTANKLWIEKKFFIESTFLKATDRYFHAGAEQCDFEGSAEKERQKINLWGENETNGKIKNLVPNGAITSRTAMVLTNAIYFKADWVRSFDKSKTVPAKFTLLSNQEVEVPMMQDKAKLRFAQFETFKALEKPYKGPEGKEFSMVFILPNEKGAQGLQAAVEAMKPRQNGPPSFLSQMSGSGDVSISIPKFKIGFEFEASSLLKDLGMKKAFGDADFSGISPFSVSISSVLHKAYVEVNEEGTEAAAASAIIILSKGLLVDNRSFHANRPFIFFIWDRTSNLILFSGLVADPSAV